MATKVAVIGAGPSGLVAAKELLDEGHDVELFERAPDLGGVFRFDPDPEVASAWETCRLTSSILVTSFSDHFPDADSDVPYEHRHWTRREYIAYLRSYVERFGLEQLINFDSEFIGLDRTSTGWTIQVRSHDHHVTKRDFDAVAICTGLHSQPAYPTIPGLDRFRGTVLHSAHYKGPETEIGDSVLFIGGGESGSEIVGEVAPRVKRSVLSLRRGVYMLPRFVGGVPNDYNGTRFLYSLPDIVARRTDPEAVAKRQMFGRRAWWLMRLRRILVRRFISARNPMEALGADSDELEPPTDHDPGNNSRTTAEVIHWLRSVADGNLFETFATKTAAAAEAIAAGHCEVRPGVAGFTPFGAVFADGTAAHFDTVILCTGWERSVPSWAREHGIDIDHLYRHCIAPALGPSLAMIGFVRPSVGAIPPMAEMQSRWFAQLLNRRFELPNEAAMHAEIDADTNARKAYHRAVFDRLPSLVDFSAYLDLLAEDIGAKPNAWRLVTNPRLLYRVHSAPFCGVQYRLQGPHAVPELAGKILAHAPVRYDPLRVFDAVVTSAAGLVGISSLRPRLSLFSVRRRR